MEAVTRSEHKRKELTICVLQHIRNVEDLNGIAKLMSLNEPGMNFIEEVRTQEATQFKQSQVRIIRHMRLIFVKEETRKIIIGS